MSVKLKQLFFDVPNKNNDYVTYQNKLETRQIFRSAELKNIFIKHCNDIMKTVESEITSYIDDEDLCNDMEDMFPRKSRLTGEWYVSEIHFDSMEHLSVQTAFIGTDSGYKDDYLGLEVHLYYDEKTTEFFVNGIDSDVL